MIENPRAGLGLAARTPAAVEGTGQLLELIRRQDASTISELSGAMGVVRSTVVQRLDHLLDLDLVRPEPGSSPARGRPATQLRFNPHAARVLGAQIGISGSRLAITDLAGTILHERFIAADIPAGPDQMLADLAAAFDDLLADAGTAPGDLAGLGVGIPSGVELATYARSVGVLPVVWGRAQFEQALRDRYEAPVFLDLDVNLLALAERRLGWPDAEVFVCVKLGTLISASIVVNGRPVHGLDQLAGELGHLKVGGSSVPCSCGGIGCLDAVASGHALVRRLAGAGLDVTQVADVVAFANQGEPTAVAAIGAAGRQIGEVLASVTNLLNPGAIVAWGYLTDAEAPLFAGLREGLHQAALAGTIEHLELRRTALGNFAGVRGAALMVIDEVLAPVAVDRLVVSRSWSAAWPTLDQDR